MLSQENKLLYKDGLLRDCYYYGINNKHTILLNLPCHAIKRVIGKIKNYVEENVIAEFIPSGYELKIEFTYSSIVKPLNSFNRVAGAVLYGRDGTIKYLIEDNLNYIKWDGVISNLIWESLLEQGFNHTLIVLDKEKLTEYDFITQISERIKSLSIDKNQATSDLNIVLDTGVLLGSFNVLGEIVCDPFKYWHSVKPYKYTITEPVMAKINI